MPTLLPLRVAILPAETVTRSPADVVPEKNGAVICWPFSRSAISVSAKGIAAIGSMLRDNRNSVDNRPSAVNGSNTLSQATSRE